MGAGAVRAVPPRRSAAPRARERSSASGRGRRRRRARRTRRAPLLARAPRGTGGGVCNVTQCNDHVPHVGAHLV